MSDNKWRKFEAVVKPVAIIALFLLSFAAMSRCEAEMKYEAGIGFLSGEHSDSFALAITEKFDNNWNVQLGYVSEQKVTDRSGNTSTPRENLWASVYRSVEWKQAELGLGVAYFNGTNRALGSKFTAHLAATWNWSDSGSFTLRHFSNAGSQTPNMGQDMLLLGWRF